MQTDRTAAVDEMWYAACRQLVDADRVFDPDGVEKLMHLHQRQARLHFGHLRTLRELLRSRARWIQ